MAHLLKLGPYRYASDRRNLPATKPIPQRLGLPRGTPIPDVSSGAASRSRWAACYCLVTATGLAKAAVDTAPNSEAPRTGHEEVTGVFWGDDGPPEIGTPPRLYMQVALAVLDQLHAKNPVLNTDEAIAGVGIAMADAGIDSMGSRSRPVRRGCGRRVRRAAKPARTRATRRRMARYADREPTSTGAWRY